jgi:ABC-2 type transport system permease protein
MKSLVKVKIRSLKNTLKRSGGKKYILFLLLGLGMLWVMGFFFSRVFGYLYHQQEFPLYFKLFLSEKILMMVFLTMFLMLVLSTMVSTLNIFFLSRDLNLLLSSPMKTGKIFTWKALEVAFNSASMVIFFSLPALFAFHLYFAPRLVDILASLLLFLLYIAGGVAVGIIVGMVIPAFFSVRRLQPVLSLFSILLISLLVIFLRLLRPEKLLNPEAIDNLFQYMGGLNFDYFSYFPFYWIARGLNFIARGDYPALWRTVGLFVLAAGLLILVIGLLQRRTYFKLYDRLNEGSRGGIRSKWKKSPASGDYRALWQKEVKTFVRSPSQWSQLLIIGAMVAVFILNLKSIPLPHPSVKTIIAYLNMGMAAFIVVGLNSRFVFTTIPMEGPGLSHLLASPFQRKKFYHFKLWFFVIPQYVIGFLLFFTGDLALKLDPFMRFSGILFLLPAVFFLTVLALYFSFQIEGSHSLSPQHLLVSKQGVSYMLWSLVYVVGCMFYFVRPLFLFYYNNFRKTPVPFPEISLWFLGFVLVNLLFSLFFYRRSLKLWLRREFL